MSMHDAGYKQRKEEFVSNLSGTSHWEVFLLTTSMSLLICMGNHIKQIIGHDLVPHNRWQHFLLEIVVFVLPSLGLCLGILPPNGTFFILCICYGATVALPLARCSWSSLSAPQITGARNLSSPRKIFVTLYRGGLMISTCLCILAVDFNAFPRRLAKAEAYGGGLMDVGVGGIIIASGLVNTCRHTSHPQHLRQRKAVVAETVGRLAHGLHEALPALVLGVGRLASVKLLGYQEHIGEYGAHWNFFCTIAVVTIIVNTIRVPPRWMGLVALLVSCVHQKILISGLGSWALSSERGTDLLSLNKEGVVSSLGYWALHLSGGALYHMMDATARPLGKMLRKPKGARHGAGALLCWWLFIWTCVDACLWLATIALETLVEPRSRRLCNAAFIAWSTALALASILPLAAAQVVWTLHPIHPSIPIRRPDVVPMPWLPRAANKNMLAVFLVANVLTGIVNMSMDTLGASNVVACATLTGYMVVVAAVAVYLEAQGVADGQKQSE